MLYHIVTFHAQITIRNRFNLNVDLPTIHSKQKIRLCEAKICQQQVIATTNDKREDKRAAY